MTGMIRNIFIVFISVIIISCDRPNTVKISGTIDSGSGNTVYLEKIEVNSTKLVDSLKINSREQFSFNIREIQYPSFYNLKMGNRNFITLLVEPGEKIHLEALSSDLLASSVIQGSPGSEALQKLSLQLRNTLSQLLSLFREVDLAIEETEKTRIEEKIDSVLTSQRRYSIGFILENMESLASITALYQKYDEDNWVLDELRDLQYLKIVSESLVKIWPESPHVKALVKDAEGKLGDYNLALMMAAAGDQNVTESYYPDIALPTPDGDTLSISSLQARYVLVIFSASWDRASVRHDLGFKPVYKNFKDKGFEIYQVSLERNTQEWFRSITFNEFDWQHVSELSMLNSRAASLYNVSNIPASFLIDKQTGILAKDITPRELNQRLSDLLN
jgi:peroxiredoxin